MDARIAHIIARMEDNLASATRVPDLAAAVQLSPSRFAHLFRDQTGVSPGRYLHRIRMHRARVLLDRTFLSVREVMHLVGFRDPSHFARDFRRFHGIPPSAARGAGHPGPAPAALLEHLVTVERRAGAAERPHAEPRRTGTTPDAPKSR